MATGRLYSELLTDYPKVDQLYAYLRTQGYTGSINDMFRDYGIDQGGSGSIDDVLKALISGGGGNAAPEASVISAVYPSSMTFSGGSLVSITDEVTPTTYTVSGTLPEDATNGGYSMTEANNAYVSVSSASYGMQFGFPSSRHISLRFKRNATADTDAIFFGSQSDTIYVGAASSAGGSPTAQGVGFTEYYSSAAGGTLTNTRLDLWNTLLADTDEKVLTIRDYSVSAEIRFGYYSAVGFRLEGTILGWEVFTDWAEVDAVEAHLLGAT